MSNETKKDELSLKDKYEILIKARNFHYENFNKWMSYFYVMIGSIFIALYYVISKGENYMTNFKTELIFICLIGFIVGVFWYWANKGYYYWNINFITLVNHYEKNLLNFKEEERIYFVFANKENQNNYLNPLKGANISTSKISILLSYIITFFWGALATFLIIKDCVNCLTLIYVICFIIPIFVISLLSIIIAKNFLFSYHNHFPDLKIKPNANNNFENEKQIIT
jgi:hypothetical protein